MKQITLIVAITVVYGGGLALYEYQRQHPSPNSESVGGSNLSNGSQESSGTWASTTDSKFPMIRAAGRVEGETEAVEIRSRITEQLREIHVQRGQWVERGTVLMTLDNERLAAERDLAAASLAVAQAKLDRLENGARDTELQAARHEFESAEAKRVGASKAYRRATQLAESNAVSRQALDDLAASWHSWQALAAAAKSRLDTLEAPPREDERQAALAELAAAKSRLRIATVEWKRSQIRAPLDGQVLSIHAEAGELTGPTSAQPLVTMSDTKELHVVADVDDFDALKLRLGQSCRVTCDGVEGTLAIGSVVEIEPKMRPKEIFGQWAGERRDTFTRRVWVELEKAKPLPVGLPVDVEIRVGPSLDQRRL